jgi:outer membrane protein TolC
MKNIYLIIIGAAFSLMLHAQGSDTLKIEDCIGIAGNRSPVSRQRVLYDEAFKYKMKNVNINWYPSVGLNAQAVYNSEAIDFSEIIGGSLPISIHSLPQDQYKVWVEINQQIFDGGTTKALKGMEKAGHEVEIQQTMADLLSVRQQVTQIYFSLLLTQKSAEILHISVNDLVEKKNVVQSGVKYGVVPGENLLAMDAEEIALQQKLTELDLSRDQFIHILSILMDTTIQSGVKLVEPVGITATDENGIRPEIKAMEQQKDLLLANQKLVTSGDYPKLFAFSQVAYGRPGYNMLSRDFHTFYSVGVGMKWNFLNYGDHKRQKKILEIQKGIIDVKRDNFNDQLEIQLQMEKTNISKYEALMLQDAEIVKLRKAIAERSLSKLNNGSITSTDYLTDMNAEIQAKLQYEQHKVMKLQSAFNYLLLQGKL